MDENAVLYDIWDSRTVDDARHLRTCEQQVGISGMYK